VILRTIELE